MYEFRVVVQKEEDARFLASAVLGLATTNHIGLHEDVEHVEKLHEVGRGVTVSRRFIEDVCRLSSIRCRSERGDLHAIEEEMARLMDDPLAYDRMYRGELEMLGLWDLLREL